MIDRYRFELFDEGGTNPRVRWLTPTSPVAAERRLDRDAIAELVSQVSAHYKADSPDLVGLGRRLFEWMDGDTERWLQTARDHQRSLVVDVAAEEQLRALPWELMYDGHGFVAVHPSRPVNPVREASARLSDLRPARNRPLRVLFMASSPVGMEPVLDFEAEEAVILEAAAGRVDVVVEESGSLTGLAEVLTSFGPGYFDVLHLSGHGHISVAGPRFVMEDLTGRPSEESAEQISSVLQGRWPSLVFLSGCSTGGAPEAGLVASMAEGLVDAGAPAVLGWALPVGDLSANRLAGTLYQALAAGVEVVDAVARARQVLFAEGSAYWHLLRLYADRSPLGAVVTAPLTAGRVRLRVHQTNTLFLDPAGRVKVVGHAGFVGRRRELQSLLRSLRPADPARGPQVAIIHGMGGLGKSTLTARLLDRMRATHPHRVVWVGRIDEQVVLNLTGRVDPPLADPGSNQLVNERLNQPGLPLADRVRFVLDGPLADVGCAFVFDDFEDGNLEQDSTGRYRCTPTALTVLQAFATAIARTASASRIIVTSRHDFPLSADISAVRQPVGQLEDADLTKKLRLTANLGPTSQLGQEVRERAVTVAAGIPRLLERLDTLLGARVGDLEALLTSIENEEVEYREELLLQQILDRQTSAVRRTIALAGIYQIAVPIEAIEALSPDTPTRDSIDAGVGVGLIQAGLHPLTNEIRYRVSSLLLPLVANCPEHLGQDELREAQDRGARYLHRRWVQPDGR